MEALEIGHIEEGYRYKGGDPYKEESWELLPPKVGDIEEGYRYKGGDPYKEESWAEVNQHIGKDLLTKVNAGTTVDLPEQALGLANLAVSQGIGETLVNEMVPKSAQNWVGEKVQSARDFLNNRRKSLDAELSDAQRMADQAEYIKADWNEIKKDGVLSIPKNLWNLAGQGELFGDAWVTPRKLLGDATQSAPGTLGPMGATAKLAGVAGKGAFAKTLAQTGSREAAELAATKAAERAAMISGGAMEGAQGAGSAYEQAYRTVMEMPAEKLAESAYYKKSLADHKGDAAAARKAVAKRVAEDSAAGAFAFDALFGGLGDRYLGSAAVGKGTRAGAIGRGALQETATEAIQSAGEKLSDNAAIARFADPSQQLMEGVGESAISGGLAGGLMGGVMGGAFHRNNGAAENSGRGNAAVAADEVLGRVEPEEGETTPETPANTQQTPDAAKTAATTENPEESLRKNAESALFHPDPITPLDRVEQIDEELKTADEASQTPLVLERANITSEFPQAVKGAETTFRTETGIPLKGEYALMEADDVTASHDEYFRPSLNYPMEMQPKDRGSYQSKMQVSGIVSRLNPARLGGSDKVSAGAPVVGADGLVESGNARTIAIKQAYQSNGQHAADYKAFLRENAVNFGIAPEMVDAMQRPMLVRVRQTPVNRAEMARQSNRSTAAQYLQPAKPKQPTFASAADAQGFIIRKKDAPNAGQSVPMGAPVTENDASARVPNGTQAQNAPKSESVDSPAPANITDSARQEEIARLQSAPTVRNTDGKPFRSEEAAAQYRQANALDGTHKVQKVQTGYVLQKLPESKKGEGAQTRPVQAEEPAQQRARQSDGKQNSVPENEAASPAMSRSAMKSVEANIARGRKAMEEAIAGKTSVHRAMYRNDIGWVDFVWGDEGRISQTGKSAGAKGLAHIIDARQRKDGMSEAQAIRMLTRAAVETIAKGKIAARTQFDDSVALKIDHNGYRVALRKNKGSNAWVLTAFGLSEGASGKGYDNTAPTGSTPTLSRDATGASNAASDSQRAAKAASSDTQPHSQRGRGLGADSNNSVAKAAVERKAETIREHVKAITDGWKRAPEVIVARDMQDEAIPEAVRRHDTQMKKQGASGEAEGFIYQGKVYLVVDQLTTLEDATRTLFHEALGHYGLKGVFGDSLDGILGQIVRTRLREVVAKAREYGLMPENMPKDAPLAEQLKALGEKGRMTAAEEILAEMAQDHPELGFVKRSVAAIRQWLRGHVPGLGNMKLTDEEIIHSYILPARGWVKNGKRSAQAQIEPMYSRRQSDDEKARILQGEPVAKVKTESVPKTGMADVRAWATKLFERQGGKAVNPQLGDVALDERAVRDSMSHGKPTLFKYAAFGAVKDVLERGALVMSAQRGRDGESHYISAPVEIDGKEDVVTVLVHKDPNTQRMYLHSVATKESLLGRRVSGTDTESSVERSGSSGAGGIDSVATGRADGKASGAQVARRLQALLSRDMTPQYSRKRAVEAKKALEEMEPVVIGVDKAIESGDIAAARSRARQLYKALKPVKTIDGRQVEFPVSGFKETAQHAADRRVLLVMQKLGELIERAQPLWRDALNDPKRPNVVAFHNYGVKASFPSGEAFVRIVLREDNDGHVYYDNDATSVEAIDKTKAPVIQPGRKPNPGEGAEGLSKNRLAQWWDSVNTEEPRYSRAGAATPEALADEIIRRKVSVFKPVDAVFALATKWTGINWLAETAYNKGGFILDHITPESVKAGLISDYGVPEAVIDRRVEMQGAMKQHIRGLGKLTERLGSLTREESRVAYAWMNNNEPEAAAFLERQLPPESVVVMREIKQMIDKLSQEAVRLGLLDKGAYERNQFEYLRRSYAKHLQESGIAEKFSRAQMISVMGKQYIGRGMVDAVSMPEFANRAAYWWRKNLVVGDKDKGMKGKKFVRLERRTPVAEKLNSGLMDKGKLREVVYWPATEKIPERFAGFEHAGTWEALGVKDKNIMMWRDFTKQEREAMGEIDEVRFAIMKTLHGMIHDVETGKYLEWLDKNYAVSDPAQVTGEIVNASERLARVYKPDEWVEVPSRKVPGTRVPVFGALAGKYIPGAIWNDLRQSVGSRPEGAAKVYGEILRVWKMSKTALSPTVHMNNVMSNFVMADWHDVSSGHLLKALRIMLAAQESRNPGKRAAQQNDMNHLAAQEIMNRFADSGGDLGAWATAELQREQLAPLLEALEDELHLNGEGDAVKAGVFSALGHLVQLQFPAAWHAAKGALPAKAISGTAKAMLSAYEAEDQVFRLAAWLRAKEEGKSDMDAGKIGRRSFLDYNINAPWIQAVRKSVFPFISYSYRAIPMLVEIAAHKPHKILKLAAFSGLANALGHAFSDGDDEEERKYLPEEKAGLTWLGTPKLIRMPWNDENSSPVFLDIRRFIPVGDLFDTGQGHSAVPMLPMFNPSGPLGLLGEIVANKSMFTGKEITSEIDTTPEKWMKVSAYVYQSMMPNAAVIPGSYAYTSIKNASRGATDAFGREQSVGQAALSSVGIKIGSYPIDVQLRNYNLNKARIMNDIRSEMRNVARQRTRNKIDNDQYEAEMKKLREKMAKARG